MTTGLNFDFGHFRFDIGGESSLWWCPMGVAVIFDLAAATFLTLIVVPVVYAILDNWSEKFQYTFNSKMNGEMIDQTIEQVEVSKV